MPLQRVAETVKVQAGAFDVVIIDEASQTGPDGLILQCLGNQYTWWVTTNRSARKRQESI
jgi:hypothetical protein